MGVTATARSLAQVQLSKHPGVEWVAIHTLPFGYQAAGAMDPTKLKCPQKSRSGGGALAPAGGFTVMTEAQTVVRGGATPRPGWLS